MDESEPSSSISDKNVKAPNVIERIKAKIEARHHSTESNDPHKESHGMRVDIDENTSITNVKAPNMFERVQEEIEALVQTIHTKKEGKSHDSSSNGTENRIGTMKVDEKLDTPSQENKAHTVSLLEKAKEELEAIIHKGKTPHHHHHHHHKETHGMSDDIGDDTPINEVKAPNVFERAKEEVEALVQTIHQKKQSKNGVHSKGS